MWKNNYLPNVRMSVCAYIYISIYVYTMCPGLLKVLQILILFRFSCWLITLVVTTCTFMLSKLNNIIYISPALQVHIYMYVYLYVCPYVLYNEKCLNSTEWWWQSCKFFLWGNLLFPALDTFTTPQYSNLFKILTVHSLENCRVANVKLKFKIYRMHFR